MIRYAALLGTIRDGLSDIHHPFGNSVSVHQNHWSFTKSTGNER